MNMKCLTTYYKRTAKKNGTLVPIIKMKLSQRRKKIGFKKERKTSKELNHHLKSYRNSIKVLEEKKKLKHFFIQLQTFTFEVVTKPCYEI